MSSEHYWDRIGHLSSYLDLGRRRRKNEVHIHTDEIGRQFPQLLCCLRPAKLDHNVFSLGVSEVAQPPTQRLYPIRPGRSGTKAQESNPEDSRRLLRAHGKRPRGRTAEQCDEVAASHVFPSARGSHPTISSWECRRCASQQN